MTLDTALLIGILFGVGISAFLLYLFRDIILARFVQNLHIDTPKSIDTIKEAIQHDLTIDLQILLDNKKTIESILSLDISLTDSDTQTLNSILSMINKRLEVLNEKDFLTDETKQLIEEANNEKD